MREALFEQAESRRIGEVDFVSPDEMKVVLDHEAPAAVALNRGGPILFPRVNGYLIVAVDDGYVVGQIEWIAVERSSSFKPHIGQESRFLDLPFPVRRLRLNPLGKLTINR